MGRWFRAWCWTAPAVMLLALSCSGSGRAAAPTAAPDSTEVSFQVSGHDTAATLELPARRRDGRVPAALIISGSGLTDRNGNSAGLPPRLNTNRNFAGALRDAGWASLRYDKIGTGAIGLDGRDPATLEFADFLREAQAAFAMLSARPEVDPARVMILGHSEGALLALTLAAGPQPLLRPRALVLAAPPGERYLDIIRRQLRAQYESAVAGGRLTAAQAGEVYDELDSVIAALRTSGTLPEAVETPTLRQVFVPANARFLASIDRADPRRLAAGLPAALPVLVLRGDKDQQVSAEDTGLVMEALASRGGTAQQRHEVAGVNHIFKVVPGTPNPAVDYFNPALRFSAETERLLVAFVRDLR